MGQQEITRFLSALAVKEHVSASTQNQALCALLFLCREILARDIGWLEDIVRAKQLRDIKLLCQEIRCDRIAMAAIGGNRAALTAPSGESCMHLERCVVSGARNVRDQRVTDLDRGGIYHVPILDRAERAWPIDWLCPSVRQGPLRQCHHALFQGAIEPPIEGRTRDPGHRTRQGGPPHVGLIGTTRCARRHDHRPHQHPEVSACALAR
jgi:hypothetical protein